MRKRVVAVFAVAALLCAGAAWAVLRPRTDEAPLFRLQAVGSPDVLDLGAARGKVVVLDLMAVDCSACRTTTKDVLKPLWAEMQGRGDVVLWSIDVWAGLPGQLDESAEQVLALQAKENATWPHALDDGTVYRAYKPLALPQVLVIDAAGRVVYRQGAPDPPGLASVQDAVAAAKAGTAAVGIPQSGLAGLALLAGAAAVFSPCSVGLLPAYFGMLLRRKEARPGPVGGGLQATAGVVLAYAAIVLLLLPFGDALLPLVPKAGIAMGLLFVLLGFAMLAGFDWGRITRGIANRRLARRLRRRLGSPAYGTQSTQDAAGTETRDLNSPFWGFGLGYALASFGCTGPVFLPLLVAGFAGGPVGGLVVFLLYATGIAVLLVFVALLAAWGAEGPLRWLTAKGVWVTRTVAVVWVLAGAYLVLYESRAYA